MTDIVVSAPLAVTVSVQGPAGPSAVVVVKQPAIGIAVPTTMDPYVRGPAGPPGADLSTLIALAGEHLEAGQPVYISRSDGQFRRASASSYPTSFAVGLVVDPVERGFPATVRRGLHTLADWTPITGAPALRPGQQYFLALDGQLTTIPPARPSCVALTRIGEALSATTLDVNPAPPILL
jgi:hypothetical protein